MAHPTRALPKRDWLDMTWQDIAGAKTEGWIAVLPLAAVEQHGPHLPLGVDSYIADAYLERARDTVPDDLPVTFLPIQRIGVSTEHLAYPGTLTVSAQTAIAAWTERARVSASLCSSPATAAMSRRWNWWRATCAPGSACWR
jgi:creatinine amidohydrolase/Fe(II)-dependent formamide hydrolase-like protein